MWEGHWAEPQAWSANLGSDTLSATWINNNHSAPQFSTIKHRGSLYLPLKGTMHNQCSLLWAERYIYFFTHFLSIFYHKHSEHFSMLFLCNLYLPIFGAWYHYCDQYVNTTQSKGTNGVKFKSQQGNRDSTTFKQTLLFRYRNTTTCTTKFHCIYYYYTVSWATKESSFY